MAGTTFKRCGCRDSDHRLLGTRCPHLRRGTGWNPRHGTWHLQVELPAHADKRRRTLRRGGYPTQAAAQHLIDRIEAILNLADPDDTPTRTALGDLIAATFTRGDALPTDTEIRHRIRTGAITTDLPTVADWLHEWLRRRRTIRPSTLTAYHSHTRMHLAPHLGTIRIDRLRPLHILDMFDAITERNTRIQAARASTDAAVRASVRGQRLTGPATMHRIRATLRAALNAAIVEGLITTNPATHLEMPTARRPTALIWTDERVRRWRATGEIPSPVMVWTPQQLGRFLDTASHDRLYPLLHLIAYRGLRRGEACGIHDADLDLKTGTLAVRWQLVQHGWTPQLTQPKTRSSDGLVALDAQTIAVLRHHRARHHRERLAAGPAWHDTGLLFTHPDGQPLHPAEITDLFHRIAHQADLPPVRLHDLRHGAATLALAAGADIKSVSAMLRHSSIHITADTYTSILPELAHTTAENIAALVPRTATPLNTTSPETQTAPVNTVLPHQRPVHTDPEHHQAAPPTLIESRSRSAATD